MKLKWMILVLILAVTVAVLLDRYRLEWVRFVAHSGLPGWMKMVLFGWL